MRPIFWFIILPVLIESLSQNEKTLSTETNEPKSGISAREAKSLLSVLAQFAKDAQNKKTSVRRQDTASAITVSVHCISNRATISFI